MIISLPNNFGFKVFAGVDFELPSEVEEMSFHWEKERGKGKTKSI